MQCHLDICLLAMNRYNFLDHDAMSTVQCFAHLYPYPLLYPRFCSYRPSLSLSLIYVCGSLSFINITPKYLLRPTDLLFRLREESARCDTRTPAVTPLNSLQFLLLCIRKKGRREREMGTG